MDAWIKLNSSSAGKDKLIRTLQYALKIVNHYLHSRYGQGQALLQWKNLETSLSSFRKLLRMGKAAEVLRGASRTVRLSDPVLRLTLTLGRIAQSLFLLADHLIWLSRARLITIDTRKWESVYYRCWLYSHSCVAGSITMNLCRDAYDIWRAAEAAQGAPHADRRRCHLLPLLRHHRHLAVDTLKNLCDLMLPLAALGHLAASPATQGACGVVSSGLALWTVLEPSLTLRPS